MADEQKLQIVIDAQDQASKVLQGLSGNVKKATGDIGELSKGSTQSQFSIGKMAASFGLGTIAVDALRRGVGAATDFVKSSIGAYAEAEQQMAQVDAILKTLNTSLDKNRGTFEAAGKAAIAKAFDDEEAQLALAKLYRATGDMKFAQESMNASMDLARDKGMGLAEASKLLSLAYAGNQRALKEYGIEVPDTASKLDILNAVQEKTSGSAEKFAGTLAGKQASLKVAFDNLKESIGQAISSAITPYITSLTDSITRGNDSISNTNALAKAFYQAIGGVAAFGNAVIVVAQGVKSVTAALGNSVARIFNYVQSRSQQWIAAAKNDQDEVQKILKTETDTAKELGNALDETLGNAADSAGAAFSRLKVDMNKAQGEGFVPLKTETAALTAVNKNYTSGVTEAMKNTNSATQAVKEHAKAIEEAKGKITEFKNSAFADFAAVKAKIQSDLVDALKDFNDKRAEVLASGARSIADILVGKQDEAAKLQADIAAATTDDQRANLQTQLDTVQAYLTKHQADIEANAAVIKNIRDNDLTDEINKIKEQTNLKLKALDEEHAQKVVKINAQMDDLKQTYKKKFNEMYNDLKKSKLFELFDDLQNIGEKLLKKKKKTAFETSLAEFIGSLTGRAGGGTVRSGQVYTVGERGPESFVPDVSGRIVKNGDTNNATNITVNVASVRSQADADNVAEAVLRVLNRRNQLAIKGVI